MKKRVSGRSIVTLRRLPNYMAFAQAMAEQGWEYVTSSDIARACDVGELLVRKDLSIIKVSGCSYGYQIRDLVASLKAEIGWDVSRPMALVSGRSLAEILVAGFPFARYGTTVSVIVSEEHAEMGPSYRGVPVMSPERFLERQKSDPLRLALLAVTGDKAQTMADALVDSGVRALWNFSPVRLSPCEGVHIVDAELASDLAELSNALKESGL